MVSTSDAPDGKCVHTHGGEERFNAIVERIQCASNADELHAD
jgi:hypothetical protein